MKTPKEWIDEYQIDKGRVLNGTTKDRKLAFSSGDLVRAIQADALRHAADTAEGFSLSSTIGNDRFTKDNIASEIRAHANLINPQGTP